MRGSSRRWGYGFCAAAASGPPTPRMRRAVAVVNEQFAKHYWPGADAVGKHIRLDNRAGAPVEIVGVAQTIKYRETTERPTDFVYLPLAQHPVARMVLLLRSNGDPLQLVQPVKDVVRTLDPNLPMLETRTYEDFYRYHVVEGPGVAIKLVGTMGAVGLAAGHRRFVRPGGVQREPQNPRDRHSHGPWRGESGRAAPGDGQGLVLVATGTAIGLAMGFAVERLMNSMLFNAGGVDVVAYLVVVPSLFLVTMLAAYVPARRASRIAPTQALRYE